MYYGNIKKNDIANGKGVRVTLFVSGCTHHCKNCFQPQTWDFEFGQLFTEKTEQELIEALKPSWIAGLTLLGGEPFEPSNQKVLLPFLRKIRQLYPTKNIWCYSGYEYEELIGQISGTGRARCEETDEMLSLIDILVDGEFVEEKKNIMLKFRGSENQRIINVPESLQNSTIILDK